MNYVIYWILAGAVVGTMARMAMPPKMPSSFLGYLVLGAMGGVLGGWLFNAFAGTDRVGWIGNLLVAFAGAAMLFTLRAATAKQRAV
jgi:uncharacterized membrane protein YeaQ/YmgE (transglycosylase-associated protein family)